LNINIFYLQFHKALLTRLQTLQGFYKGRRRNPLPFNKTSQVDGPEYSPDGKYIYYNANKTGTMQVWRMKTEEVNASHYEANIAGVPRVLAHLKGGQGPINVPS
jgi:hypothetical protein